MCIICRGRKVCQKKGKVTVLHTTTSFKPPVRFLVESSTEVRRKVLWEIRPKSFILFVFQSFTWNLGRPVDEAEVLQLAVVSRGVLRNEKVAAKYGLVLQTVVREGRILVSDSLVDLNNKPLPVRFDIESSG